MLNLYSKGEIAVQKLAGEYEIALSRISMLTNNKFNAFSTKFIESQEVVYITSIDKNGHPWVSILFGQGDFFQVINDSTLKIKKEAILSNPEDILYKNILHNPKVGLLFLSGETRRRFRLNGVIFQQEDGPYIKVEELYGICPKYIQKRTNSYRESTFITPTSHNGIYLTELHRNLINKSDTFYLGTQGKSQKVDCSHKGGKAGFVNFINDNTLIIPDYSGNSMFNSLGNIYENPNAALLFIDYENQATFQVSGQATLQFDRTEKEAIELSGGTGRFWHFTIKKWQYTLNAFPVKWKFIEYSPFNP